jgi:hypothetical protein
VREVNAHARDLGVQIIRAGRLMVLSVSKPARAGCAGAWDT